MGLVLKLDRERVRLGEVQVDKGSVRAPDKNVATLKLRTRNGSVTNEVWVELNAEEATALANALRAAVR